MFLNILFALSITLMIEPIVATYIDRFSFKIFIVSSLSNIVLNISMNLILLSLKEFGMYRLVLYNYEVATIFAEALIISLTCKKKFPKCLLFSAIGNLLSYITGSAFNGIPVNKIVLTVLFLFVFVLFFVLLSILSNTSRNKNNR